MIQLGLAPCRMDHFGKRPIRIVRIAVGVQRPLRVRDTHVKYSVRLEHAMRFRKKMRDLSVKFEVFKHMFAIDAADGRIAKKLLLAQVESAIGVGIK